MQSSKLRGRKHMGNAIIWEFKNKQKVDTGTNI